MKQLKNWDNKTWLSSKKYIAEFNKFISTKKKLNQKSEILDIGCGRANIISTLQKKYKFEKKPIGIDIVKNKGIKKNIFFKKSDGILFLKNNKKKYDLILLKQTMHFFSPQKLSSLFSIIKLRLKPKGKLLIFSLKTKDNKIPCFTIMRKKLKKSLKKDEKLFKIIKKKFLHYKKSTFTFKVVIKRESYIKMIRQRYISCLLNLTSNKINSGVKEIKRKYRSKLIFDDSLYCFSIKN